MRRNLVALVVLLLPLAGACDISGSFEDDSIIGGETARFDVEIDPAGGVIEWEIESPMGTTAEYGPRQIDDDFTIKIHTEPYHVNGTYSLNVEYVELQNGTECGKTVSANFDVLTDATSNVSVTIYLNQSYIYEDVSVEGTVVEGAGQSIKSRMMASAVKGTIPSFYINDTQLSPGESFGKVYINFETCPTAEDYIKTQQDLASYFNEREGELLSLRARTQNLTDQINGFRQMKVEAEKDRDEWKKVAGGKWEPWTILIGVVVGAFIMWLLLFIETRRVGRKGGMEDY